LDVIDILINLLSQFAIFRFADSDLYYRWC